MQQPSFLPSSFFSQLRSSLLLVITFAYLLGQACGEQGWFPSTPWWVVIDVLLGGLTWLFFSRPLAMIIIGVLFTFQSAAVTLQKTLAPDLPANHLRRFDLPQEMTIEGWLFREPNRSPHRGRLYLDTLRVWQKGVLQPATGKVLLSIRSLKGSWRYGDLVRMTARFRPPHNFHTPGSFDYEGYLARQQIYVTAFLWDDSGVERIGWQGNWLRDLSERLRREISAFFSMHLEGQTAAVLQALIVGDEGGLTKETRTAFARAGVAHVLSISGLHISLVATASYGLWWWLLGRSRYLLLRFLMPKIAALLTLLPVLFYASLSGGNVATWRAVIMVATYLLAILCGRQEEIYRSLALAALVISLLWPGAVLDISFQLSFLSVLSIIIGMNRFSGWWEQQKTHRLGGERRWDRPRFWLLSSFLVSFCALISTAPITAFYFNQISVAGFIANLLIIPLLGSGAVLLGLLTAATLFLSSRLASFFLFGAGLITQTGLWLTRTIGGWSWAAFSVVTPTLLELLFFYGCLGALLCYFFSTRAAIVSTGKFLFPIFALALLIDSCLWLYSRNLHRDLRITFLDVGQGDAAVVELPGPQVMVIDGGGFASEEFDSGEAILAPFLWSRKIGRVDFLVMSHPQLDHYGGLTFLVEHFAPRELWFNGEQSSAQRFTRLWTALQQNNVKLKRLCRDSPTFALGTIKVEILHPPCGRTALDTNNASLVLRLSHGTIDFLFPGDLEAEGEQFLLTQNGSITSEVLKAPHHGSRTSSTQAFVDAVSPQLVAASLGYLNRFKFPAREVVQRYEEKNARFLRTDRDGAVSVVSNGQTYTVVISHKSPIAP